MFFSSEKWISTTHSQVSIQKAYHNSSKLQGGTLERGRRLFQSKIHTMKFQNFIVVSSIDSFKNMNSLASYLNKMVERKHCTRKLWWQSIVLKLFHCQRHIVAKHFRYLSCLSRVVEWYFRGKVDSEIRVQVIPLQTQKQSFNFFLWIQLGVVLMHTNNLLYNTRICYKGQ